MFDTKKLLDQFMGAGGLGGASRGDTLARGQDYLRSNAGGLAGGALAGGLAGLLLGTKSGRKLGKTALTYGGMALVGGLAYKAYRDWQANKTAQPGTAPARHDAELLPPPSDSPFAPQQAPGGEQRFAMTLLTAMIAAAKADGHIDQVERARIFDKMEEAGLGAEERAFIDEELAKPLDIERIVAGASTPEQAVEIYAASRLAIDPDHPAERGYLAMLAARLALDPGLVAEVDRAVAEA